MIQDILHGQLEKMACSKYTQLHFGRLGIFVTILRFKKLLVREAFNKLE